MPEPTPVIIPREHLNDEFVTLVAWLVANGARVEEGQALAEVESSKAVFEIPAPLAGIVQYTWQVGEDVAVGGVLCSISSDHKAGMPEAAEVPTDIEPPGNLPASEGEAPFLKAKTVSVPPASYDGSRREDTQQQHTRFSQKALALLKQRGLAPHMFAGRGFVRTHDILDTLGESDSQATVLSQPCTEGHEADRVMAVPEPVPALGVPVRTEELPRRKRTEVRHLASSYHHTLASVITVAVPTRGLRAAAEHDAPNMGHATAIILFEAARLLRQYPDFNAFYADGKRHVYEEVNVGFAVDAGHGLKVPVIRHADAKGIQEIAGEMQELLVDYVNDTLRLESLVGGTFTVTDLSSEGVFTFHPLINQGQSAILGVGGEFFPPGSREGLFNLILAFDHQLSEGRQAATFLNALSKRLQAYEQVLGRRVGTDEVTETLCCSRCLTPLSKLEPRGHCLVHTVQRNGNTGYICSICLQGW
jgi:2-oxoglutarate dehydrogenase E2 component (dihydrolipoamide succinyltransferase)